MFVCNDEDFLNKLYEGDELMNAFRKKVNYVLDNLDVLMYYDRDKLLREGAYDDGLAQGKEQGIKQGIEQGIEQGGKSKSIEIAKKMLSCGYDIEDIIELTDLSKEEIKNLQGRL